MLTNTQTGEASTPPKIEAKKPRKPSKGEPSKAVTVWKHGDKPDKVDGLGATVLKIGDDTGRVNKLGKPIFSKSMLVATPSTKVLKEQTPGLSEEQAWQKQREIGTAIKPVVMGRVSAAGASNAYIVRRYAETPGKRDKIALTLERLNVESTVEKLAREYNMTVEEVRKRLNIKSDLTVAV